MLRMLTFNRQDHSNTISHVVLSLVSFFFDKRALTVQAHYGDKISGRDFWHHVCSCLTFLGYTSRSGDRDVWMDSTTLKDGT